MTERENVLDRAYRLAHEAETGGDHLLQAQNELNSIALNERAAIAAQMERDSRVDHAKHPEILELDVKVDPARKDNYVVSVHKPSPEEGTIRAGHDEYKMSGFGKTETIAGTVGGMTGTGIGGVG